MLKISIYYVVKYKKLTVVVCSCTKLLLLPLKIKKYLIVYPECSAAHQSASLGITGLK